MAKLERKSSDNFKEEKDKQPLDIQIENETMDTIRSFVSAHLDQDISVAELANHMHKSVRQLQRICKLDTGLTPSTDHHFEIGKGSRTHPQKQRHHCRNRL